MTGATRVTQRLMVERSLSSLQTGLGRLARVQEQLSTGRVLNRPSDSPTDVNAAMRLRSEISGQTQYARNAENGLGWLGQIDTTLTSMLDAVRRARGLALQGASTGTNSASAREALSVEVGQIRESVLGLANTTYLGRPVFGGTTAGDTAYDSTATFVGDHQPVNRTIADGIQVQVNVDGEKVFGTGTDDLFGILADIADHLTSDPDALPADIERLDTAYEQMTTAHADVGTRAGRVEAAVQTAKDTRLDLQTSLSEIENVDLAQATVELKLQEVAYQASLAATARVMQPSLIDFLR